MRISHACDTDNFRFAFVNVESVFSGKAVRQDWIRGRNEYHRVFFGYVHEKDKQNVPFFLQGAQLT